MTYDLTTIDIETLMKESQTILETLPLADYLKVSTIKVDFDKSTETSYFDLREFRIIVAFKNIFESIVASKKSVITDLELEKIIRNFLYHEISHAILTPRELMQVVADEHSEGRLTLLTPEFANIIEDERIETILKNYYYGVDFKKNIKTLCPYQEPTSFKHFVFNCVRLRQSPIQQEFVNGIVNDFINCTKKYSAYYCDEWELARKMNLLLEGLKVIWDEYVAEQEKAKKSSSSKEDEKQEDAESSGGDSSKEESEDTEDSSKEENVDTGSEEAESSKEDSESESQVSSGEESKDDEDSSSKEEETENADESSSKEESETEDAEPSDESEEDAEDESLLSQDEIKEIMGKALKVIKSMSSHSGSYSLSLKDFETTNELTAQLLKIIVKNVGVGIQESQAQYGYCGRFSAKRFMKDHNDSYKWFEKHAIEGNTTTKKSSKKILNIWLDQSGSFRGNDAEVNEVLKSLYIIESKRKDFEWRLIKLTCDCNLVEDKEKRYSSSFSGNALPVGKIKETYEKVNSSKNEFNVVLFDGDANSLDFGCGDEKYHRYETYSFKALEPFNNKRSIFITERRNTESIKEICPNSRAIIEENTKYAKALKDNVCKALDLLF